MEWTVEDLGAADLELEDAQFVAVADVTIGVGEWARQHLQPPPDEALDVGGRQAVAELLEGPPVVDRGQAVVEGLVADVATLQLALRPAVAVQPYAGAPRGVRADLDEAASEVSVPDVEVDVVDVRAQASGGVAAGHPIPDRRRPEHRGPLLGDADEHDPLATGQLGGVEVRLGERLLALAALEVDERDGLALGQPLDGAQERGGPLAEDRVARDLLARLTAEEAGETFGRLEVGNVAVQEDPVEALVAERDVVIEERIDVGHGDPPGTRKDRPLWARPVAAARVDKGLRPSRRQPAQASLDQSLLCRVSCRVGLPAVDIDRIVGATPGPDQSGDRDPPGDESHLDDDHERTTDRGRDGQGARESQLGEQQDPAPARSIPPPAQQPDADPSRDKEQERRHVDHTEQDSRLPPDDPSDAQHGARQGEQSGGDRECGDRPSGIGGSPQAETEGQQRDRETGQRPDDQRNRQGDPGRVSRTTPREVLGRP